VGNDQSIINSLLLLFPERIITMWQNDPDVPDYPISSDDAPLGPCGSLQFYYQLFVASVDDLNVLRDFWKSKISWILRLWVSSQSCRLTRLLAMKDVLQRQFGYDWAPPKATIDATASYRS
jgi:hypothetical protein